MSNNPSLFAYKNGVQLSSFMGYTDPMSAADTTAAGGYVYLDIDITRSTSFTATSKWIGAGGVITAGSNNITGNFWAPPSVQMFNAADTNTVILRQTAEIYVSWFGAKGDNSTDDSNAFNQALKCLVNTPGGGTLKGAARGQYVLNSQISATIPNFQKVGYPYAPQFVFDGNNCVIKPVGAISGLDLTGGSAFSGWTVKNTEFYLYNNATSPAGLRLYGTTNAIVDRCSIIVGNNVSTFTGIQIANSTPSDDNTGSFWTTIQNCNLRTLSGGAYVNAGIRVYGTTNSLRLLNNRISGFTDAIQVTYDPSVGASTTIANAVFVGFNAFEGIQTNCINIIGTVGGYTVSGLTVVGNRFETVIDTNTSTLGNIVALRNATLWQNNITPYIGFNENITFGATICYNPNNIPVTIVDPSADTGSNENKKGFKFTSQDASKDVVVITPSNTGSGLALTNSSGTILSSLRQTSGSQSTLTGNGLVLGLGLINGISATTTVAQNLRGSVTFASAATATVTFSTAETNSTYFIAISGSANETFWVTSKGTSGFTINSSNATSTATVNWILIR